MQSLGMSWALARAVMVRCGMDATTEGILPATGVTVLARTSFCHLHMLCGSVLLMLKAAPYCIFRLAWRMVRTSAISFVVLYNI